MAGRPAVETPTFPLMAWNHAPDPAALGKMKECGLTVPGFVAPEHLDQVHRAGMKAIVFDPLAYDYNWRKVDAAAARKNVARLVKKVGKHPAVMGYYIKDEPSAEEFAGLATVGLEFQRLDPGKWPYINLFPNYATSGQLGSPTYEEYLDRFIDTCRPPILSYDNYSIMEDGTLRPWYWLNLEQVRRVGLRRGLPFWNIVLSVAHFQYRELTAADARFQAFTTLAYGGRGLSYFTYITPRVGNYRMGPVDQFGNTTPTWHHLQNVNLQIRQLAPTLLKLRSDEVYHFGSAPDGSRGPSSHSLITGVGDAPFLVGDFTHEDGSRYAMVVNKSFTDSSWCHLKFRRPPTQVLLVSPYTGRPVPFDGEQRVLAPGQGSLLKLE